MSKPIHPIFSRSKLWGNSTYIPYLKLWSWWQESSPSATGQRCLRKSDCGIWIVVVRCCKQDHGFHSTHRETLHQYCTVHISFVLFPRSQTNNCHKGLVWLVTRFRTSEIPNIWLFRMLLLWHMLDGAPSQRSNPSDRKRCGGNFDVRLG